MDSLLAVLSALNSLSPLAVIALLALVLFYQAKNSKTAAVHAETLTGIKTNDLHEVSEMAALLRQMNETLQRMEVSQEANFSYIRARINGGGK